MNKKISRFKIDWRYAVRELVLIVAGILIAIALNSWWNNRIDFDRESDYLAGIVVDINNAGAELEATIRFHQQQVADLQHLLNTIEAGPGGASEDSLVALSHALIFNSTFEPELATLEELYGAGNLNLIKSAEIRKALTLYQYQLQNNNDFNDYLSQQSSWTIEPFFMRNLPYLPRQGLAKPYKLRARDLSALYSSLHFHNLVLLRLDTEASVLQIRKRLLESMQNLKALIEEELDRRA